MSDDLTTPKPVQPLQGRARVETVGNDLVVTLRPRSFAVGCFLFVFLIGWSTGCVALLATVVREPKLDHLLFATPFFAAWFFLTVTLIATLFGKEQLRVGPAGVSYVYSALVRFKQRDIPLAELKRLIEGVAATGENGAISYCLLFETIGHPLQVAQGTSQQELSWLIDVLNRHLATLRRDWNQVANEPQSTDDIQPDDPTQPEVLARSQRPVDPPSDSSFVLARQFDSLQFVARGRWSLTAIVGTTFICLFWNGIVSVFINQLVRDFQWFLFFFLIPFEVVGLLMFTVWLAAIFAPAFRLEWTFNRHEILWRFSIFGLGRSRRYSVLTLDRIELHREALDPTRPGTQDLPVGAQARGWYSLSFVTRDNQELLSIKRLTEGEGRWIADCVYREFPRWFPR